MTNFSQGESPAAGDRGSSGCRRSSFRHMTEQPRLVTERVNERLDQLDQEVVELQQAEQRAAIGAMALVNNIQTANIKALVDVVRLLAAEIDLLRVDIASS